MGLVDVLGKHLRISKSWNRRVVIIVDGGDVMGMKKITYLLIGIGVVVFALVGARTQSATDEFRFEAAKLKDTSVWTQVNKDPYYISASADALCRAPSAANYESERKTNPHAGTYITVYVNQIGRDAMFSKKLRRFPEGSVIVKEKIGNYFEGRKPVLYTLMRKREPGYNPAVGDWEFSVVAGNGTQVEAIGKLENCQGCHINKQDSDFVFRPYVNSQ